MKSALLLFLFVFMTSTYAGSFKKFKLTAKDRTTTSILFEEIISESGTGSGFSAFGGQPILKNNEFGLLKSSWGKDEKSIKLNFVITKAYNAYYVHPESGEVLKTPVYDLDELNKLARKASRKFSLELNKSQDSVSVDVPEFDVELELKAEN